MRKGWPLTTITYFQTAIGKEREGWTETVSVVTDYLIMRTPLLYSIKVCNTLSFSTILFSNHHET